MVFLSVRERKLLAQELQEFVRSRIADYKAPERILFLPVLPKGSTGKVERRELKDLALALPEMALGLHNGQR